MARGRSQLSRFLDYQEGSKPYLSLRWAHAGRADIEAKHARGRAPINALKHGAPRSENTDVGYLSRTIDWFVPSSLDAERARRARLVTTVCGTIILWGPLYTALFWHFGLTSLARTAVISSAVILAVPFLLRATGSVKLAGNVLAGALFLVVTAYSISMGGIQAPGALWHSAFPIAGFAMASLGSGIFWTAAAVVELACLFVAERAGWIPAVPFAPEATAAIAFASDIGLVLVVLTFALSFEFEKNHAIDRMREANLDLADARDAADAANRAKSEFLANMSHEIRTLMNGVVGMAELLAHRELPEEEHHMALTIHRSGGQLLEVLDEVLDLSKLEAARMQIEHVACSPRQVVENVLLLLGERAREKGLRLRGRFAAELPRAVLCDPVRLQQVLVNLVSNGLKFTEKGGVEVGLRVEGRGPGRLRLRCDVTDTGIGIAPEKQEEVFEDFTQADCSTTRRYGGTGLGLSISRRLVELMGGEIGVESVPGEGTTLWFALPVTIATGPPQAAAPAKTLTQAPRFRGRVLVAEDNPVNLRVTVAMLESLGCDVEVASDGFAALAALQRGSHNLLLMDCQMPGMDGLQAAALLREAERADPRQRPRIPIVAVTASARDEDVRRCLDAGMDDYLAKPFDRSRLVAILERWLSAEAPTA